MDLPIFAAAALGLTVLSSTVMDRASPAHNPAGAGTLVGQHLYATEDRITPWTGPLRAESLALDDLGTVARVLTDAEGEPRALVVKVGGLWGLGAQEVELGMDRVHVVRAGGDDTRLVVDLSAEGGQPAPEEETLDL